MKCDICERELGELCPDGLYRCQSCMNNDWMELLDYDEYDPREEALTPQERNPGFEKW